MEVVFVQGYLDRNGMIGLNGKLTVSKIEIIASLISNEVKRFCKQANDRKSKDLL